MFFGSSGKMSCEFRSLRYLFPRVYKFEVFVDRAVWWVVFTKWSQLFPSLSPTFREVTSPFLPLRGGAYFPTPGVRAGLVTQFDHENVDEVLCARSQSRLKGPCVLHLHNGEQCSPS